MTVQNRRKRRIGAVRRRRRNVGLLIFALLFILCAVIITRVIISLPYESVDLSQLASVEFAGFNNDGVANVVVNNSAVDELLATVKAEHDSAWFHTDDVEDGDYVKFRQSLSFITPTANNLYNGQEIPVVGSYDANLAEKLKIEIKETSGTATVSGLQDVTKIGIDEVFRDLSVTFDGVSPSLSIAIQNNSTQPLVQKMIFEIEDPKEFYADGDVVRIHAAYTEDMCRETGYIVDTPSEECVREYTASSESSYITSASDLPAGIIKEAVEAGKKAFKDANEYGVRIFCEANLVPVYINKKATFQYGTPNYVSSYFKTVFPEKAGGLGISYNDLDIIYDVKISQADGVSCTAYGAVRFTNIVKNSDGTYSYDFSDPSLISVSYLSSHVKKNVVDSFYSTHEVERVYP
ncbi:MAG: hypothetical protein IJ526_10190 [Lachnospiraceae bacterium]|nr:hypothetical protein [Lachnospiraceae bacterium]